MRKKKEYDRIKSQKAIKKLDIKENKEETKPVLMTKLDHINEKN